MGPHFWLILILSNLKIRNCLTKSPSLRITLHAKLYPFPSYTTVAFCALKTKHNSLGQLGKQLIELNRRSPDAIKLQGHQVVAVFTDSRQCVPRQTLAMRNAQLQQGFGQIRKTSNRIKMLVERNVKNL